MTSNSKMLETIKRINSAIPSNAEKVKLFSEGSDADVKHVLSTGSLGLDFICCAINEEEAGLPFGRVFEFFGPEGVGKTTMAIHLAAEVQKIGGIVLYMDNETSLNKEYVVNVAEHLGASINEFIICEESIVELCFPVIEATINAIFETYFVCSECGKVLKKRMNLKECNECGGELVRKIADENQYLLVIVDSVGGLITEAEESGKYDAHYYASLAKRIKLGLKKLNRVVKGKNIIVLFINHVIADPSVMFGDKETTPGGKFIKYQSSIRVKIGERSKVKKGDKVVGKTVEFYTLKNKVHDPFLRSRINILFGKGFDAIEEIFRLAKQSNIITKKKNSFFYNSELLGVENKVIKAISNDKELRNEITAKTRRELFKCYRGS